MMNYPYNFDEGFDTPSDNIQTFIAPVDGVYDVFGIFGLRCLKGDVYTYNPQYKTYKKGNDIFAKYLTCNILVVDELFAEAQGIRYNEERLIASNLEIIYKSSIK